VIGRTVTEAALTQRPASNGGGKGRRCRRSQRFTRSHAPTLSPPRRASASPDSVEQVARESDIMTVTVTTDASGSARFPYIDRAWIKPGALLLLRPRFGSTMISSHRETLGSWLLLASLRRLGGGIWRPAYEDIGIVGNRWHGLTRTGIMPADRIEEIADVAMAPSRLASETTRSFFSRPEACRRGRRLGHRDLPRRAGGGIGVSLNLWESPALA